MRSDNVKKGMQQAPHRSLFNALGFTKEEMDKPMIGIVSSYNEIVPGHMNLDKIVEAVKLGVAMAGGVPVVFPAIAVCDGIAMGHVGMKYSLVTRDLIADSTECMAMAHQFDGLVMVPNCDKNVPGLLMAAARINIPTVFVSGGPMLAGHVKGQRTSLSSMFEAVGAYAAGKMTEEDVYEYECKTCPTCGSCSGMYTANSMNCLTEALGMGLQGNGTIPAVYSERIKLAKHAGMKVMEMVEKNICPRDIMTEKAFVNALTVDMALGCSTNSMLHLPAIAREAGVALNAERGAAAAGAFRVRIGHDKARTFQPFGIVDRAADQILQAHRVNHQADALFLNGHIPFVHLIVKGEAILETAATAAGDIHAQFQVRIIFIRNQVFYFIGCGFGKLQRQRYVITHFLLPLILPAG